MGRSTGEQEGRESPGVHAASGPSKQQLRAAALGGARRLPADLREGASARILAAVLSAPWWSRAEIVLCYVALPTEVRTAGLIEAARRQGRAVGLPRVVDGALRFHAAPESEAAFERGTSGVLEPPESSPPMEPRPGQETLVIVPGVLFDADGYRLGRGGGHYDRLIARARPAWKATFVGLCFDEQLVERLPRDPWDERVDAVLTERRGIVACGASGAP
jgi:5-formyltetrahydrofolate cyclo-ligase